MLVSESLVLLTVEMQLKYINNINIYKIKDNILSPKRLRTPGTKSKPGSPSAPNPEDLKKDSEMIEALQSAKSNPKFQRVVQHMEVLIQNTRSARTELEQMVQITRELRNQCSLQEKECVSLENDQSRVKSEVEELTARMQALQSEKTLVELKLEELRQENAKLETFLAVSRNHRLSFDICHFICN